MGDPYYKTPEWKELRAAALKRDRYRCTVAGCNARATRVDHIKSRRTGGADALPNLRCLCAMHDNQVKESHDGSRRGAGFRLIGCGVDGWPAARG